ncbi:hypothetical protein NADFUDRAFT_81411 [Nadsonia fulvescens var. elongata DSM 6958]|uniref:Dihydroorotate dehydrogenase (quinone), mitochondrial n=1 Tax=Nadsonia fulvescens var. elongata DSM 6958 TaxID=857566 RepID=A0A1E3PSP9_9ASCO|nr:hypothetical protein NADFUDRAFT_81411 [Nadsonia fulvescens var. elongata DSM 6958]
MFARSARRLPLAPLRQWSRAASTTPVSKTSPSTARKLALAAAASLSLAAAYTYYTDAQSSLHGSVLLPIVRLTMPAEFSHSFAIQCFKYGLSPWEKRTEDEIDPAHQLEHSLFGGKIRLRNILGVAAGLDKHGDAIDPLFDLGFGYVEIGSVTPLEQPGNPKPRFFRLIDDNAVINRYGFNSVGHAAVADRLRSRLSKNQDAFKASGGLRSLRPGRCLALNLGKNKTGDEVQDYVAGVMALGPYADVLVINVSSPNTPGLRDLQAGDKLTTLLSAVVQSRNKLPDQIKDDPLLQSPNPHLPPIVVKIAPDLSESEVESIAHSIKHAGIDGVIVSNTTIARPDTLKSDPALVQQAGGLSGTPVKPFSLAAVRLIKKYLHNDAAGKQIDIIGCGGISSSADALEFAHAGASAVQLYTAFAYQGGAIAGKVKRDLVKDLKGQNWKDIVGKPE